ncbi:trypsin domain-containing protein [Ditylenchus destructor]|uniref:Trypsin domain-containing protein n=1 Tax=Ditylenchus destructor TaxID=166010 RepID=A0AAD4R3Y5_9BILA|nr:trypsin domain-containing protein [Ditylenchus destructor]
MRLFLLFLSFVLAIAHFPIVLGSSYKFRAVDHSYNLNLQKHCANPQFLSGEDPEKKIMHGVPVPKGKYPWAVALNTTWSDGRAATWCGGTLISSRHVLTARHCFETEPGQPRPYVSLMVGGVCYAKGEHCKEVDMRSVEIEFAAFEPKVEDGGDESLKLQNHAHDLAIVQLKEDLKHFAGGNPEFKDTRPACIAPQHDKLPKEMHVYGWGVTEKSKTGAKHLMEVNLPVLDIENDPLAKKPEFEGYYHNICTSPKLYCLHSPEPGSKKDGAGGDSGTGIAGRRGHLAVLYGSTIAGVGDWQLNIATRVQQQAYDICYYTGVCTEKAWAGHVDAKKVKIKLRAFFDPNQPKNIVDEE